MPRFAVDSASPVTDALWSEVTKAAGTSPAAWFRYVGGPYAVSTEEVNLLHGHGCALGLVYNGASGATVAAGHSQGQSEAQAAIAAAEQLGAPHTMVLFADIESTWKPSPAWLTGWADGQRAGPYAQAGGIYGNPLQSAFITALTSAKNTSANVAMMPLWSAEPQVGASSAATLPAWRPATCADQAVAVWQYALGAYGGIVDLDLIADEFTGLWNPATPDPVFTDVPAEAWYAAAVADAVKAGLMEGLGRGVFAPSAVATRADLAVVVSRIAKRLGWV